jgi:ABC-2 type transport system permease protein
VADVTRVPGVWEQIQLVAGLRWRILRNGLRKQNSKWDLIGLIFVGFFAAVFALCISVLFFFGGYEFMSGGQEKWMALLFWAIFVFWQMFPIFTAGFGAAFDFRNLLRFPLSMRAFYVVSLSYGLADFGALASICWLIAMALGAAIARPGVFPVLSLVCVLFLLMNATLERTIGSWLERILARRRTREIFFALFILCAVSVQFISPMLQRYGHQLQPWVRQVLPYFAVFPPSLAGRAVAGAALNQYLDVLIGAAGVTAYLLLISVFLLLRLAAQFRGEELSESAAPARRVVRIVRVDGGDQPDAPSLLSPLIAAVLRKEFRYLMRNTFAFFLLIMPLVFVLVFTTQFAGRRPVALRHPISLDFFFPAMMGYLLLILMGPAYNVFAFDGKGIQTFFTAPVRFRDVFLAKNVMSIALVCFELPLAFVAFCYFAGVPSAPTLAATISALVFIVVGQLTIANWSSLAFPRKLVFGQMRGQRQSGMAALVSLGTQLILGGICAPILFLSRLIDNRWLPAEIFAFLAAVAVVAYFASLDPLSDLAEKKKETLIEALCR